MKYKKCLLIKKYKIKIKFIDVIYIGDSKNKDRLRVKKNMGVEKIVGVEKIGGPRVSRRGSSRKNTRFKKKTTQTDHRVESYDRLKCWTLIAHFSYKNAQNFKRS